MAIVFDNKEELSPEICPASAFLDRSLAPDAFVSEISVSVPGQTLDRPEAPDAGLDEYPGISIPGEEQIPAEGRVNGSSRNGDGPYHENLGAIVMIGLSAVDVERLEREEELERFKRLGDPEIDHVAEIQAMAEADERFVASLQPGGENHSHYTQAFQYPEQRSNGATGTRVPPVIDGRQVSGAQWEVLAS